MHLWLRDDHHHVLLGHLQDMGVHAPTLPEGNGRVQVNGRAVCIARTVRKCVDISGKRGLGETWRSPTKRLLLAQKLPLNSLSLRLLVQAQLLQHPRHRAVRAQGGLQQRGTRLGVGVSDSMDSSVTWRMYFVPTVWGLEHSMWARCMEGVCNAATHCSRTAGSHSWLRTDAARLPTLWSNHSASRRRAGFHSWDWAEQAQRWGAVSGCAPQRRHVVSSTVLRWGDRCSRTVIVGMSSMRCADIWLCWSLSNQSRGRPLPCA